MPTQVEKRIRIAPERAEYLSQMAQTYKVSVDQIIEQALDVIFSSAEPFDNLIQRMGRVSRAQTEAQSGQRMIAQVSDEDAFKQHLREIGLLTPKQKPVPALSSENRLPIQIQGKPLSETIIEERR